MKRMDFRLITLLMIITMTILTVWPGYGKELP